MVCRTISLCLLKESSSNLALCLQQLFINFSPSTSVFPGHTICCISPSVKKNDTPETPCSSQVSQRVVYTYSLYFITFHFLLNLLQSLFIRMKFRRIPSISVIYCTALVFFIMYHFLKSYPTLDFFPLRQNICSIKTNTRSDLLTTVSLTPRHPTYSRHSIHLC